MLYQLPIQILKDIDKVSTLKFKSSQLTDAYVTKVIFKGASIEKVTTKIGFNLAFIILLDYPPIVT